MTWTAENIYNAQAAVDNRNALRQEIADAVLQNRPAILPAGAYRLDCANLPGGVAIEINANVTIKGAGRSVTVLRVGPDLLSTATTLFYIHPFKTVVFEDLTLEGPPNLAGGKPDGSDATPCFGIYHEGGGELKLKNVAMRAWNQCIKADALPSANSEGSRLTFTDCVIGGRCLGLLQFEGSAPNPAALTAERCQFEHDANAYTGQQHNLYIAEGVDMTFRHCRWTRSVSYGITMYGGHGRVPVQQPLFDHCEFAGAVFRALQTNKRAKTIIRNCLFRNPQAGALQITLSGDADIEGCHFEATQQNLDVFALQDDYQRDTEINVKDCSFGGSYLYYAYRFQENTQKHWTFTNCTFAAPLRDGFYLGTKGNVGKIDVVDSHFAESAPRRLTNNSNLIEFKNCTRGPAFTAFAQVGG